MVRPFIIFINVREMEHQVYVNQKHFIALGF